MKRIAKMERLFLFTLFLGICVAPLVAQDDVDLDNLSAEYQYALDLRLSYYQKILLADSKGQLKFARFEDEDSSAILCSYLEISDGQKVAFQEAFENMNESENEKFPDYTEAKTAEERAAFLPVFGAAFESYIESVDAVFSSIMTDEQLQKLREIELVGGSVLENSDMGLTMFLADSFQALDLTDEQKVEIEAIRQEAETTVNEFFDELRQNPKMLTEGPGKKWMERIQKTNSEVTNRIDKILTSEQKAKRAKLEREVPKKLKELQDKMQSESEAASEDDSWKKSWKPGDPIPEKQHLSIPARKFFPMRE
ncbi:MAG: hypothetical protein ACRC2T_19780 [Thermoguttaceae bacterium]